MIMVTPADLTDRDAARELLWRQRFMQPQVTQIWADSACAGQPINGSDDFLNMTLNMVSAPRGEGLRRPVPSAAKPNATSAGS